MLQLANTRLRAQFFRTPHQAYFGLLQNPADGGVALDFYHAGHANGFQEGSNGAHGTRANCPDYTPAEGQVGISPSYFTIKLPRASTKPLRALGTAPR